MWQDRPLIFWTRLIAVTFVATGRFLLADDQPAPPAAYKVVPITVGGKTVPLAVEDPDAPSKKLSSSDAPVIYNPTRPNLNATSSMANKSFSLSSDPMAKSNADFNHREQDTFITKSYTDAATVPTAPNLDAKASFPMASASSRNATGFDKNYPTSNAEAAQARPALLASATSTDQGRTAVLGNQTTSAYASTLGDKTFQGPEADAVHRHLTKLSSGQMLVTDLPNRPLTIDEVRDLINHGFKPNTDVKPEESSKPLNDPDYKPEPLRLNPAPDASSPAGDDDKNDPVPPPGTMAAPQAPENSEPLPQP